MIGNMAANRAHAQTPGSPKTQAILGGIATLAVTTTSANVALPAISTQYPVVTLLNDGTSEIFVRLGNSSVTATTSYLPIPSGISITVWVSSPLWNASPATYVAAITSTGSSTLRILQANGQ